MKQIAFAALTGAISACDYELYGRDWGINHGRPDSTTITNNPPVSWMYQPDDTYIEDDYYEEEPPHAPCDPEPERMKDSVFFLKMLGEVHNSFVKGAYHSDLDRPIPEECFGDWIHEEFATVHDLAKKGHHDFWSVTKEESQKFWDTIIDMHYKNMGYCKYEKIADEIMNWCVDNGDVCIGWKDWPTRLLENGPAMAFKFYDLYKVWSQDDFCFSDEQLIGEIAQVVEDTTSIKADVHGFDVKWDEDAVPKHITHHEFREQRHEIRDRVSENGTVCPFLKAFKDFDVTDMNLDSLKDMVIQGLGKM